MNSESPRPVLIHYHVFKNAGTTVESILRENFGSRFCRFEGDEYSTVLTNESLLSFLDSNPNIRALSSHHLRPPKPIAGGIALYDLVLLRHPLDRLASTYDFYRRSAIDDDPLGRMSREMDLPQFCAALIERFPHVVNNAQVNYMNGGNKIPRESDLRRAINGMKQLSVLGVTDLFDMCMVSAECVLGREFGNLDFSYTSQNVSPGRLRSLPERLQNIEEACGSQSYERLVKLNKLDIDLFDWTTNELQQRSQQIANFRERMNDFAARCKALVGAVTNASKLG